MFGTAGGRARTRERGGAASDSMARTRMAGGIPLEKADGAPRVEPVVRKLRAPGCGAWAAALGAACHVDAGASCEADLVALMVRPAQSPPRPRPAQRRHGRGPGSPERIPGPSTAPPLAGRFQVPARALAQEAV